MKQLEIDSRDVNLKKITVFQSQTAAERNNSFPFPSQLHVFLLFELDFITSNLKEICIEGSCVITTFKVFKYRHPERKNCNSDEKNH